MSAATTDPAPSVPRLELESLLSFWADAGVDTLYADSPVDRTRPVKVKSRAEPLVKAPAEARAPTAIPAFRDLDAPRRLAEAAPDLDSLRAVAGAFLRETLGVAAPVLWRGAADAPVVVIGEAPGLDDENAGSPFAGAAGRLLDRMLAAAGLTDRAFITQTVFWRPPGDRQPTPDEQALCTPFLERAIALVAPRALLLVGAGVAKTMLGRDEAILALHGRWLEWRSADGAIELPALPTLSPAFLLRQPTAKAKSWSDLLILTERIDRLRRPD